MTAQADARTAGLVNTGPGTVSATHRAKQMLARAHWAAGAFATYDRAAVLRVAEAAATAAHGQARKYAEWAVAETGFGVAEHKLLKNEACSLGVWERYRDEDFVSPRIDPAAKIVALPRPAGVVLALTPSTNPVCSVFFKVIIALLTRNAIVVSPHPMAAACCTDAARLLAAAAVEAGAPDGVIQVVEHPTVPLIETLMADPVTGVIVATGGTAVVRAAHRSGNPALGVGPGNVPVLVDATADVPAAARRIADSKAFDNSVLCTNESVLIAEDAIADQLTRELQRQRAAVLDPAGTARVRDYLFPDGRLSAEAVGKDAAWIAERAGVRVPPRTRLLVAPIDLVVPEELLVREKLSPVLGLVRTPTAERGIEAARAVVRIGGPGHSAAIHSQDAATILGFGSRVPVLRISVNVGNSTGSSGLETNLAPSMTLGTGFAGRSSIGENLEPRHLVNWARIAYNADAAVPFGEFSGLSTDQAPDGPVPAYPDASNLPQASGFSRTGPPVPAPPGPADPAPGQGSMAGVPDAVREQLRALIIEELRELVGG
ncbi:MAG TPA: aldehyde dehydrogenase family protein [Streptosporangiaceae bacterium]|nr:aldehyde dehydrogenase family protein [Streptosporangiaceae bacterium]